MSPDPYGPLIKRQPAPPPEIRVPTDPNKSPGEQASMGDWMDFIYQKWVESVGHDPSYKYSMSLPDMGFEFYTAVSSFRLALNTTDAAKKIRRFKKSGKAAGNFVQASLDRDPPLPDNIRRLYKAMKSIKKGGASRIVGNAKDQVGQALMDFLGENNRLPNSRGELKSFRKEEWREYDLAKMTSSNLSEALAHYSLNKRIRDKTGPTQG